MVTLARRAERIPFAPVVAALFGTSAAILVGATPHWLFENAVVASGLPNLLAAAAPPLGTMARLLAIVIAFAGIAFVTWAMLATAMHLLDARKGARTPWRDAGYDADLMGPDGDVLPRRRPIFAPDELGAPLMSDEAIAPPVKFGKTVPDFMNEPKLAEPIDVEALAAPIQSPATADNSIATLIRRLEDGLARRAANDPHPDGSGSGAALPASSWIVPDNDRSPPADDRGEDVVRQALGTLRKMARG